MAKRPIELTPAECAAAMLNNHGKDYVEQAKRAMLAWCRDTQSMIVDLTDFGYVELAQKLDALRNDIRKEIDKV